MDPMTRIPSQREAFHILDRLDFYKSLIFKSKICMECLNGRNVIMLASSLGFLYCDPWLMDMTLVTFGTDFIWTSWMLTCSDGILG